MKNYRQCGLAKDNQRTIGWIEERGAKLGAMVEIDGEFWKVTGVGDSVMTGSQLAEKTRMDRNSFHSIK